MLLSDRCRFLEAVTREKRTSFGGFVCKAHVQETLNLSSAEADRIVADLVQLGYLQTQGFGNLDVKLSREGLEYLVQHEQSDGPTMATPDAT